ncbi:MAG: alanine racemase [bacterium]
MRPTYAEINLKNLQFNYQQIRKKTKTKVIAVVKADAYGHGMIECVKAFEQLINSPEYYAVALIEEAIELRKAKIIKKPILCFAPYDNDETENYLKYNISATVNSIEQLDVIKKLDVKKRLKVHIKFDTGMGRVGIKINEIDKLIRKLIDIKNIIIEGIYTHFATSDEKDKTYANYQLSNFNTIISKLKENKINYGLAHAANSGAILDMPEAYFDAVRPGMILYGYYPSFETSESIKLKPVMSLLSKVTSIKQILNEESVSYGRKFIAKEDTLICSVPIGYADGFNRNLTNKATAIIKGKVYNQVGRVTMDRILFEIKNDKIKIGDKVILLGTDGKNKIDADDWSKILDTIPYEITCNISKRIPRIYK